MLQVALTANTIAPNTHDRMGLFKGLFGKKEDTWAPADLSRVQVDIHSHFIPGIDDGSQTLEQTIELLTAMKELAIGRLSPRRIAWLMVTRIRRRSSLADWRK